MNSGAKKKETYKEARIKRKFGNGLWDKKENPKGRFNEKSAEVFVDTYFNKAGHQINKELDKDNTKIQDGN